MAKNFFRRATKTFFLAINLFIVLLFLLACLSPFINPANWWVMGFTGLIVPYLIVALILFIIFWLITNPRLALLSFFALCLGWQQISVVFAWHPGPGVNAYKRDNNLRVISWNVRGFNGVSNNKEALKHTRDAIAASILKMNPDLICLQEFNHSSTRTDNLSLFSKLYPYYYFSKDYVVNDYQSGVVIFSKYPIVDSGRIKFPVAESLIYTDIKKGNDTLRVFNTHLQSFKFGRRDYNDLEKIRGQDDETLAASKNIFRKMRLAFRRRGTQATIVREALDKTPHPSIICGDFNDVPNSFTYFHIRNNWQDAFLRKGFAVGRSFIALAPTLRIDYILTDLNFEVRAFDMVDEALSDHIMLVSDIVLKK